VAVIWLHSGYCLAVWSVIYPHFLPSFLPESIGHARVVQHRIKSKTGFDSVIALFSGFWIKIIRKNYFQFGVSTTFFFIEKSWQKRTCACHSNHTNLNIGLIQKLFGMMPMDRNVRPIEFAKIGLYISPIGKMAEKFRDPLRA